MKLEITVTEVNEIIKSLPDKPEPFFEMMRVELQRAVTTYMEAIMRAELTEWLGRERYCRGAG